MGAPGSASTLAPRRAHAYCICATSLSLEFCHCAEPPNRNLRGFLGVPQMVQKVTGATMNSSSTGDKITKRSVSMQVLL